MQHWNRLPRYYALKDSTLHEQSIWASLRTISFDFFLSHPARLLLILTSCVNTRKEDRDVQISSGSCASRERAVTSSKKNNTRKLSANYLYRFNSWLISSSVRNIVSVFATAKQLLFLWFQLYSNHDYSLLNTNCVIRSVTSFTGPHAVARIMH